MLHPNLRPLPYTASVFASLSLLLSLSVSISLCHPLPLSPFVSLFTWSQALSPSLPCPHRAPSCLAKSLSPAQPLLPLSPHTTCSSAQRALSPDLARQLGLTEAPSHQVGSVAQAFHRIGTALCSRTVWVASTHSLSRLSLSFLQRPEGSGSAGSGSPAIPGAAHLAPWAARLLRGPGAQDWVSPAAPPHTGCPLWKPRNPTGQEPEPAVEGHMSGGGWLGRS